MRSLRSNMRSYRSSPYSSGFDTPVTEYAPIDITTYNKVRKMEYRYRSVYPTLRNCCPEEMKNFRVERQSKDAMKQSRKQDQDQEGPVAKRTRSSKVDCRNEKCEEVRARKETTDPPLVQNADAIKNEESKDVEQKLVEQVSGPSKRITRAAQAKLNNIKNN